MLLRTTGFMAKSTEELCIITTDNCSYRHPSHVNQFIIILPLVPDVFQLARATILPVECELNIYWHAIKYIRAYQLNFSSPCWRRSPLNLLSIIKKLFQSAKICADICSSSKVSLNVHIQWKTQGHQHHDGGGGRVPLNLQWTFNISHSYTH